MLPPKKWFGDRERARPARRRASASSASSGASTCAPYSPVRIAIAARRRGRHVGVPRVAQRRRRAARGSPRRARRRPRRRTRCGCRARRPRRAGERGAHLGLERARHADAVLVLRELVVVVERRGTGGRRAGSTRRRRTRAGGRARRGSAPATRSTVSSTRSASAARVRAHLGLGGVRAHAERHDADGRELREAVEHAEQRVVEHGAVVDARAHDDLAVHLDAGVEQRREPAQARRAAPVAQQPGAHLGVGGVDAHVERARAAR